MCVKKYRSTLHKGFTDIEGGIKPSYACTTMILYTTDLLVHKASEDCLHSKTTVSVHTSTLSTCARVHLPFLPVPRTGDRTCLLLFLLLLLLLLVSTFAPRTKLQTFLMHRVLLPGGCSCCCGGSFLPPGAFGGRFCVPWAPCWFGPRCDPSAFGESGLREKKERKSVVD